MSRRLFLAGFTDGHDVVAATRAARRAGYRVEDVYTPYAVHGLDQAMGLRPSRLSYVCFTFGLAGALGALWLQHWTSVTDWALNVGGKPLNSLPAFIPVAFEVTVLLAGLGTVAALLMRCRLYPGKLPLAPHARVTDDMSVLVIEQTDASFDLADAQHLMRGHGAVWMAEQVERHIIELPLDPPRTSPHARDAQEHRDVQHSTPHRKRPRRHHASVGV